MPTRVAQRQLYSAPYCSPFTLPATPLTISARSQCPLDVGWQLFAFCKALYCYWFCPSATVWKSQLSLSCTAAPPGPYHSPVLHTHCACPRCCMCVSVSVQRVRRQAGSAKASAAATATACCRRRAGKSFPSSWKATATHTLPHSAVPDNDRVCLTHTHSLVSITIHATASLSSCWSHCCA